MGSASMFWAWISTCHPGTRCAHGKWVTTRKPGYTLRMAEHGGGQWNVAAKDNQVYLERVSEDNGQLFEDTLAPEEARQLARLLTKHADKISESGAAARDDDYDDSDDDDWDDDSEDDDSDDSDDSDDDDSDDDSKDSKD